MRFARAFGSGRYEERTRHTAEVEVERSGSLFRILGVEPGASRVEISATYKRKARV